MYPTHTDYILQVGQDHVYIYNAKYVTSKHENTQPLPWEMRERGRLCSLSLSCNTCWCVRTWWCYHCYQTVECACRCRECRECQVTRIIYTDYIHSYNSCGKSCVSQQSNRCFHIRPSRNYFILELCFVTPTPFVNVRVSEDTVVYMT